MTFPFEFQIFICSTVFFRPLVLSASSKVNSRCHERPSSTSVGRQQRLDPHARHEHGGFLHVVEDLALDQVIEEDRRGSLPA